MNVLWHKDNLLQNSPEADLLALQESSFYQILHFLSARVHHISSLHQTGIIDEEYNACGYRPEDYDLNQLTPITKESSLLSL